MDWRYSTGIALRHKMTMIGVHDVFMKQQKFETRVGVVIFKTSIVTYIPTKKISTFRRRHMNSHFFSRDVRLIPREEQMREPVQIEWLSHHCLASLWLSPIEKQFSVSYVYYDSIEHRMCGNSRFDSKSGFTISTDCRWKTNSKIARFEILIEFRMVAYLSFLASFTYISEALNTRKTIRRRDHNHRYLNHLR